jgi:hypothetical protein
MQFPAAHERGGSSPFRWVPQQIVKVRAPGAGITAPSVIDRLYELQTASWRDNGHLCNLFSKRSCLPAGPRG